jgi:ABC-2 type transport system permease protein
MKRSVKIGTYSFCMGIIVLAALIIANLLVGALPAKITRFDTTNLGLTEISDETAKFVSGMTEDVTVYWLCEDGLTDDQFELLLTRYAEAGKHIAYKVVDPLAEPTFTAKYTDSTLSNYSLIVESGRRHTVVDAGDMYYYTNAFLTEYLYSGTEVPLSAEEFEEIATSLATSYGVDITQYETSMYFKGEALITSALDYVTKEHIPHAYLLTGHGDTVPSKTLSELLDSMNMDVEELNLQVASRVPEDANCVILFSPKNDISAHEAALLSDYIHAGGSLMLTTSPELAESCPNLQSVVALFGLSAEKGMVAEGDASYISGSQYTLVPSVSTEHGATAYVSSSNYKPRMPKSHAITVASTLPAGVTVTPLFTTSKTATRVAVADTSVTLSEAGQLCVAVAATKSVTAADGTAKTADLTWYASSEAFTDACAEATSGGNYYYFGATLSFMSEAFSSVFESLGGVNMSGESLTGLTVATTLLISAVIILVLPVGLLTTGIVVWVRRKRR